MKRNDKLRLAVVVLLAISAVAAYKVQTVPEMTKAAKNLLVTLSAEQKAKIMIQVQMCTRWRSSASSTIRQVQAVCEMRHKPFIKAAATK